jgi:predicted O-linked N-acetylglucosamine transferase (SPINDLY family)
MTREGIRQQLESAVALHQAGKLEAASSVYRQILAAFPDHPDALHLLGVIAHQRGKNHEAVGLILHAIDANPNTSDYYANLGAVWNALGCFEPAARAYRDCLRLDPKNAGIHVSLARALNRCGDCAAAAEACRAAIAIDPTLFTAHRELAVDLNSIGEIDAAIAAFREAHRLNPSDVQNHSNLIFAMETREGIDQKEILDELKNWNRLHAEPIRHLIKPHRNKSLKNRKLRVGWVSADFRHHVVARCIQPIFQEFDRSQFDLYAYSLVEHPDAVTQALRASVDHWREIFPISVEKAVDLIRGDEIDILVDLALHAGLIGLPIFAYKPAPIQVCYLGYCGSTGLQTMDYRISQPDLEPPGLDLSRYSEQTLMLSGSYFCYRPEAYIAPVQPLPASANGFITFGCLNSAFKISSTSIDLFARVLAAVPGARMIIYTPSPQRQKLILDRFALQHVDPARVQFIELMPWKTYIETYNRIDIFLDTTPYGGGITACDSLLMGVPIVTLRGQRPVGRMAASFLSTLGHADLIADTPDEFVQTAAALASDAARLAQLRSTLRGELQSSPIMNARQVTSEIQQAFKKISAKKWA